MITAQLRGYLAAIAFVLISACGGGSGPSSVPAAPGATTAQPGTSTTTPGMSTPPPGTTATTPGMTTPSPGMVTPPAGMVTPPPDTVSPVPGAVMTPAGTVAAPPNAVTPVPGAVADPVMDSADEKALQASLSRPTAPQASRFLAQASFGASAADINAVAAQGIPAWIDKEFVKPQPLHSDYVWEFQRLYPKVEMGPYIFLEFFWKHIATEDDQLRQRVSYALSQIFVVSLHHTDIGGRPIFATSFYDMLGANAFGNFRTLLEGVTLHPAMGTYLNMLHSSKEWGEQAPDENFAREIMQLMSIGLFELNADGTRKLVNGQPVETYSGADIRGLAKVFTGWSYAGPDKSDNRFWGIAWDVNQYSTPMQSYPQYHSVSEKSFLGITIPAQSKPDPAASLKIALDRLFNHPNVGPFIGKQLIQRLVTSNPSPAYVARVSAAFANNGQGVRGDMKAVIKAILLDPEARKEPDPAKVNVGKLREPVLRLAAWMRAFGAYSTKKDGVFYIYETENPQYSIGQSPLSAPTVFNFYRPGYVPPNTTIAKANLVAPEMQLVEEISIVGYLNTLQYIVPWGLGDGFSVLPNYSIELGLADTPDKLIDRVNLLLLANQMTPTLRTQISDAIKSVSVSATDTVAATAARKNRVSLAIYLTMASTEFLVQK